MATDTAVTGAPETMQLRLASGNGPVTRTVLRTPLRDALPSEVPLIDISPIFSTSVADRKAVACKIHDAATNIGFFYIQNHRVPSRDTDMAYSASLDFFRQDMEAKMKADAKKGPFDSGYRGPGTQRVNPDEGADLRETYSILYDPMLDPTVPDPARIPEPASRFLHLGRAPFESTDTLPHFKDAFVRYFQACLALARALTRTFALSLDLPESAFDSKVQYPDASLEINFYPPISTGHAVSAPADPDTRVSIGSHTDFLLFTILWQDSNGGLQVLNREGQWIRASPVEGTFVVNIGDYLQRITNDKYVSTVHRAQNWSGRQRVSMPFFWGFGMHESCQVLESCCGEDGKSKYDEVRCVDWVSRRLGNLFDLSDKG
uniref:2-oxoglutarate-Fe(II) type oxidoreductase ppzC n=1 Tax=Metarhizium majus (strain ARSEF 297) TaxID=1276143 RepID=PPZC_METMF|nr:TPA_exp: Fe(II)/2OG-dependent dioxygenase [Metarhizium majus ARSEF 297]